MDLRDYLHTLRKRWRVVLAAALLGLIGAAAVTLLTTPVYQAKTQLFVSTNSGDADVSSLLQGNSFTQARVKSYAAIVDSPEVLKPVIDDLQLDITVEELAMSVNATVPLDTVLINVTVDDTDAVQAAQIANAIGREFSRYVATIEQPADGSPSLIKVSVVRQADVPTSPISPRTLVNLAIGLLAGLLIGFGLALLREALDTTVQDEGDLEIINEVLGRPVPVLGAVVRDPDAPKRPLIVHVDPQSARAEAFRSIRTNLQFIDIDNPPRTIVITSSLPEEGKSTSASNLAISLAQAGFRVALVEADLRRPRLAQYLGVEGAVGLTDILVGRALLSDVLQPWGGMSLDVLASGTPAPNPSELLGSHAMLSLIKELEDSHDIVILDAPPLLPVTDAAVMSAHAAGAILIVRAGKTTRDQIEQAAMALRSVDARLLGVVMTMVPQKARRNAYEYGYSYTPQTPSRSASRRASTTVVPEATPSRGRRGRRS